MLFSPKTNERDKQPEVMDQPGLDAAQHKQALRGLARINWMSGSDRILWQPIRRLALEMNGQPLRVLDLATGGGDVPIRLHQRARRAGLAIAFAGADIRPTAIEHARAQSRHCNANVEFFCLDACTTAIPNDYDVLMSSLFLHHLDHGPAVDLLGRMGQAARRMVLINDLIRSRLGYWLAWLGTRVLTTSSIVHTDGPLSVRAAFAIAEARQLADEAGLHGAAIYWRWPFRFLLQWRPSSNS